MQNIGIKRESKNEKGWCMSTSNFSICTEGPHNIISFTIITAFRCMRSSCQHERLKGMLLIRWRRASISSLEVHILHPAHHFGCSNAVEAFSVIFGHFQLFWRSSTTICFVGSFKWIAVRYSRRKLIHILC